MQKTASETAYRTECDSHLWYADGIPILSADYAVPYITAAPHSRAARRINRYYRQYARSFLSYCGRYLYPQALIDFRRACETGAPLPCGRAQLTFHITRNSGGVLSLYSDCTEWAGTPNALTVRRADTWDMHSGCPLTLRALYPSVGKLRRRCLRAVLDKCHAAEASGHARYAEDLPCRLRRSFNMRNFYLSEEGVSFFFQPYSIASTANIPVFLFPQGKDSGAFPPDSGDFSCNDRESRV